MLQKPLIDEQRNHSKKIHQSDPKNQPFLLPFLKLYNFIISTGAIPVRLVFYKNIGERSISILGWLLSLAGHFYYIYKYAIGTFAITGYIFIPKYLLDKVEITNQSYSLMWFIIINGVFIYFLRVILYEGIILFALTDEKNPDLTIEKGTYYRGDPILSNPKDYIGKIRKTFLGKKLITKDNFNIFVEPQKIFLFGLCFSLGGFILAIFLLEISEDPFWIWFSLFVLSNFPVGLLVSLSAICLVLEEYGIKKRIRDAALDIIDGEKDLKLILETKQKILEELKENQSKNDDYPIVKIG